MSKDSRKAKQRQKRQEKKRQMIRATSGSPYRRVAQSGEIEACYVNEAYRNEGLASILVLRRLASGGYAMAAFLVDLWCIGLKDAYGRLNATRSEFDETVRRGSDSMTVTRIDPGTVRRLVAGAIRFSHENGFRLPHHYERWTAVLGDVGDWRTADISAFGKDGGLLYVGDLDGLRKRLIGDSVQSFLSRPGVHYLIGGPEGRGLPSGHIVADKDGKTIAVDEDPAGGEDEEAFPATREEAIELLLALRENALRDVHKWCETQGETPHPRLSDAWDIFTEAMLRIPSLDPTCQVTEQQARTHDALVERALSLEPPTDRAAIDEALAQLCRFASRRRSSDESADHAQTPNEVL